MPELKLIAFDADDLAVMSAHLQDAVLQGRRHRLAAARAQVRRGRQPFRLGRMRSTDATAQEFVRRRTAVRFERVLGAKVQGIDLDRKDAMLALLAISFDSGEAPAGNVTLRFADGGAIRLEVECIEAELKDLGPVWRRRPSPTIPAIRPRRETGDAAALPQPASNPMPIRLTTSDPGFESAFAAFLAAKREVSEDVDDAVRAIVATVRSRGDAALIELTQRFDRLDLSQTGIRVSAAEIAAAVAACDRETLAALEFAARASTAITAASCPATTATRTRSAPSSARAGRRSSRSASTCRAGSPATQARC